MADGAAIAAAGMQSDVQRVNIISQNLSNVLTPGYKRMWPVATSFSDLSVTIVTTPGGATTRAFALMANGVATALTCTIANPAVTCSYTGSPVSVPAGQKIDWRQVNTGAVAANTEAIVSVCASP